MKSAFGDHVTVAMDGHVAVVTLNRPPHNFVSVEFMRDLADAIDAVDADPAARAVVLQADGKCFFGRRRLRLAERPGRGGHGGVNALYLEAVRLYSVETPIVAAVQGAAIGAGLGLALVADFRIASAEARFSGQLRKAGLPSGVRHHLRPPSDRRRAAGQPNDAHWPAREGREALAWGLADELVPPRTCAPLRYGWPPRLPRTRPSR